MALTNKLSAIGDAIREKTGKTELLTLDAMPLEIASITTGGGGGDIEIEPIVLSGNCTNMCSGFFAGKYIETFSDKISTNNITIGTSMFEDYEGETIPFELNFKDMGLSIAMNSMFNNAKNLKQLPKINNCWPQGLNAMFQGCYNLREIPDGFFDDWNLTTCFSNTNSSKQTQIFYLCYSLRNIPSSFLKQWYGKQTYANTPYYYAFGCCYVIDEIKDVGVLNINTYTSNMFSGTLSSCYRLKNFTFALNDDNTPKTAKWKSQSISIALCGYAIDNTAANNIMDYNSGITADKEVIDDVTYQALKDNPDWFSCNMAYSRYNKTSAINTINTLPDTSAYLAEKGGTNTITFRGAAGAKTDGGAINTLTAEEIAVATAKGWTVSFV